VDVDIGILEKVVADVEFPGAAADEAEHRLGRLLEDLADGTGQDEFASSRHHRRLDADDLAARLGPHQAGGDAHLGPSLGRIAEVLARPEEPAIISPSIATSCSWESALRHNRAILRQISATSRSRLRRPDSRV